MLERIITVTITLGAGLRKDENQNLRVNLLALELHRQHGLEEQRRKL